MITPAQIDQYVTNVTHVQTHVSCVSKTYFTGGVDGYVWFINGQVRATVYLPKQTCKDIEQVDNPHGWIVPSDFLVLTHELMHIALNSENECDVERAARANEWQLVKQFKLTSWVAKYILDHAWEYDASLPENYHVGCTS